MLPQVLDEEELRDGHASTYVPWSLKEAAAVSKALPARDITTDASPVSSPSARYSLRQWKATQSM